MRSGPTGVDYNLARPDFSGVIERGCVAVVRTVADGDAAREAFRILFSYIILSAWRIA